MHCIHLLVTSCKSTVLSHQVNRVFDSSVEVGVRLTAFSTGVLIVRRSKYSMIGL